MDIMTVLVLLTATLAAYRLTRLIVRDDFPPIQWVRDSVTNKLNCPVESGARAFWCHTVTELLSCPWCIGWWISAATVGGLMVVGVSIPVPVLTVFAISSVVGILSKGSKY